MLEDPTMKRAAKTTESEWTTHFTSSEFKVPQQRTVNEGKPLFTSGETAELQSNSSKVDYYNQNQSQMYCCANIADTVNSDFQVASVVGKSEEHQPEPREPDKDQSVSANSQEFLPGPAEIPPDMTQANVTTMEIGDLNSDSKDKPEDESDLECASVQHPGSPELENNGENETQKASSSQLQMSPIAETVPDLSCHEVCSSETGNEDLCEDIEKNMVKESKDPKVEDSNSEGISGSVLAARNENVCSDCETKPQMEENESVEPPAKKRLRKRMGMCGLGDKKRRLPYYGQRYRQALIGGEKGRRAGTVAEDSRDGLKSSIIEAKDTTAPISDMRSTNQEFLEQDKYKLEYTTGQDQREVQDQPPDFMTNDISTTCRSDHPILHVATNGEGDTDTTLKNKAVYEEEKLHAETKVGTVDVTKEVTKDLVEGAEKMTSIPKEPDEGMTEDTQKVQELLQGLEESEMKTIELCPADATHEVPSSLNSAAAVNQDLPTEDGMDPLFLERVAAVPSASSEASAVFSDECKKKDQSEDMESLQAATIAVSESAEPDRRCSSSTEDIILSAAPPTGQEKHIHSLPEQDPRDLSLTSAGAKQPACDPSMTPDAVDPPQEPDSSVPLSPFCSVTDSQLSDIALSMELGEQSIPESSGQQEDTAVLRGLIRELSFLNRTVMAAHREMELLCRANKSSKFPMCRK